ncbi:uncharacterized protein LOC134822902 [Bolinopsis microptera]|uniref:uncharacterized protein LOC134822902 n=1 Tax=Bolinopsis microptera TaxID=2820187 RepID=UPI0030796630
MDTLNFENHELGDVNDGKVTRVTRCRRAPLINISNSQRNNLVSKKAKKSTVSPVSKKSDSSKDDSYLGDVFGYLVRLEQSINVCPHYMDKQHDLKPVMRSILVDWIIQACTKFKLTDETQYYAIQYIDRFLTTTLIERSNLQLVGIGAIFIACKFEEICVPSMSDLCYITEDTYTPKELERMESKFLLALDYDLGYPTTIQFLRYIVKVFSCSRQQYYCGKFLCELMSVSYPALQWKPSEIAVSSLDILNEISTFVPALRQLHNLQFNESSIADCKRFIRKTILNDELSDYVTVFTKYDSVYKKLKSELK